MKLLGVELTPLWVPIQRRLQTLSIIFYVSMFMLLPIVTYFTAIGLLFTSFYWITIGYIAWCIYDNYFSKVSIILPSYKTTISTASIIITAPRKDEVDKVSHLLQLMIISFGQFKRFKFN